jgi:hypothetical protein
MHHPRARPRERAPTGEWMLPVPSGLVGPGRFERPTSPLSGVRSNQLSYGPLHPSSQARWGPRPPAHGADDEGDTELGLYRPHTTNGNGWRTPTRNDHRHATAPARGAGQGVAMMEGKCRRRRGRFRTAKPSLDPCDQQRPHQGLRSEERGPRKVVQPRRRPVRGRAADFLG